MDAAINFPSFDVCWQEEGGKKIDVLGKNCQVTSLLLAIEFNHLCLWGVSILAHTATQNCVTSETYTFFVNRTTYLHLESEFFFVRFWFSG